MFADRRVNKPEQVSPNPTEIQLFHRGGRLVRNKASFVTQPKANVQILLHAFRHVTKPLGLRLLSFSEPGS